MCLAVPGQILEIDGDQALVDMQGNQLRISVVLTPEVTVGSWVLAHAGFAISQVDEADARETWEYLRELQIDPTEESGGADA